MQRQLGRNSGKNQNSFWRQCIRSGRSWYKKDSDKEMFWCSCRYPKSGTQAVLLLTEYIWKQSCNPSILGAQSQHELIKSFFAPSSTSIQNYCTPSTMTTKTCIGVFIGKEVGAEKSTVTIWLNYNLLIENSRRAITRHKEPWTD